MQHTTEQLDEMYDSVKNGKFDPIIKHHADRGMPPPNVPILTPVDAAESHLCVPQEHEDGHVVWTTYIRYANGTWEEMPAQRK